MIHDTLHVLARFALQVGAILAFWFALSMFAGAVLIVAKWLFCAIDADYDEYQRENRQ